jgi:hypothetical protein
MTAVIYQGTRERLLTINAGSILTALSETDAAGMIEAVCDGNRVRVFERDLEERSERVEFEVQS